MIKLGRKALLTAVTAGLTGVVLSACTFGQPKSGENTVTESSVTESISEAETTTMKKESQKKSEFYTSKITDDIFERIEGRSYKDYCTLPVEDLRYIHVLHVDRDGKEKEGEIICNKYIADDVLDIFEELYKAEYPIESVRLVDEYDADDEKSMADNNSSSFNYRLISYSDTISKHALGLAVDINPRYNPYVKEIDGDMSVEPENGVKYVDRDKDFPYKIDENDLAYKLFTKKGFEWGGEWEDEKDYQHFEMPDKIVEKLYPDE